MNSGVFSSASVCAILEAAAKAKVQTFSYHGLTFSFSAPEPEATVTSEQPLYLTEAEAKRAEGALMALNEQRLKREKLETLKITDPEAYEELIASGELIQSGDDEDAGQEAQ